MSTIISSAQRQNLNAASMLMKQMESTQERVSTGREVNSASDDAYAYFTENSLRDTASDLDFYHKEMDRGIKTIQSATTAIQAMGDLAERAEGLVRAALETEDRWERDGYRSQVEDLMKNIGSMAQNAEYRGVNLLGGTGSGNNLSITLDANQTNTLNVSGVDFTSIDMIDPSAFSAADVTAINTGIAATGGSTGTTAIGGISGDDNLVVDHGYAAGDQIVFDLNGAGTDTYTYTVDDDSTVETFINAVNGSGIAKAELSGGDITFTTASSSAVAPASGLATMAGTGATTFDVTLSDDAQEAHFNLDANLTSLLNNISSLKTTLDAKEGELSNFEVIAESFADFTEQMISLLEEGADNLVVADVEEESVKLNVLQTRQQLAMISISLGTQAEQNVMRLF